MIASLRGLVVLAAIACALAVGVAIGGGSVPVSVDRAVMPGFDPDRVHEVDRARAGVPALQVVRDKVWRMVAPPGEVDARAIDAVLASLRGARWHRRADPSRAGALHATLTIDHVTIGLGESVAGGDQAWIVVGGRALLVDGWVARALELDPLTLRDRAPFAAAAAEAIRIRAPELTVAIDGRPPRGALGLLDPQRLAALDDALDELAITTLPAGPIVAIPGVEITVGARTATIAGPCPGAPQLLAMRASFGDGCVEPAAMRAVTLAAQALIGPEAVDRRPAAVDPLRIVLADGTLDLEKRARIASGHDGSGDADPDRVAELVTALAEPAAVGLPSTAAVLATIEVTPRHGEPIALELHRDGVLHRGGESTWLRPSAAAWANLTRPIVAYADPTRWVEDPTTITAIAIDGVTYTRGAVLGEWVPHGTNAIDGLAQALAQVRAPLHALPPDFVPRHHITVTLAPPVGAATRHVIELGAGCLARIDGVGALAPPALCAAVAAKR